MAFIPPRESQMGFVQNNLKCTACKDDLFDLIQNCTNDHYYCNDCYEGLTECIACKTMLPKILGAFAQPDLSTASTSRQSDELSSDEEPSFPEMEVFDHRKQACPLKSVNDCTWNGYPDDIIQHCSMFHYANMYKGSVVHLIYPRYKHGWLLRSQDAGDRYHILINAFSKLFKCEWQLNSRTRILTWCVYYMGDAADANKYYFEVVFRNIENLALNTPRIIRCRTSCYGKPNVDAWYGYTNLGELQHLPGERGLYYSIYIRKTPPKQNFCPIITAQPFQSDEDICCNAFYIPHTSITVEENNS